MEKDQPQQDDKKEKMKEKLEDALKPSKEESVESANQSNPEVVSDISQGKKQKTSVKLLKEEEVQELTTLHERTIACLSYFGFLAIVPFYLKKESKFCRYHGKQGMMLAIIFFLGKFLTVLDVVMDFFLILQAIIALWMGLVALSGKWKRIPLIYKWSVELEDVLSLKTKEEEKDDEKYAVNEMSKQEVETK